MKKAGVNRVGGDFELVEEHHPTMRKRIWASWGEIWPWTGKRLPAHKPAEDKCRYQREPEFELQLP